MGKSLLDLIIRIHSGQADKIAAEQVLNDQFILQLQAGDRNLFIQKNQDIENHLLDILDQFPDNAKIDTKIEEDAVIENTLHSAERLASLYKSILKYTLSIDVPRTENQ